MNIRNIITTCLLAAGLAFSVCVPQPAEARTKKVVYKKKHKHHRHAVGLRHIGRGSKTKTVVKTSH